MMGCFENRCGFFSRWCKGKVLYIISEESPNARDNTLRASCQLEETVYDIDAFGPFISQQRTEEPMLCQRITINDETLRLWLNEAAIPYKKRKAKKHRQRRERRAHFGELVQIDGSHHDWFEGRGPVCVFMGYIDDATNTVHGRFYDYEGTMPAMDSMKRYIKRYGIPKSVYLDKHTTYKSWAEPTIEEQLNDQKPMSHFEKSLAELGDRRHPCQFPPGQRPGRAAL